MQNKLIFLFDGGCPLCLRETRFLKKKDVSNKINFIDINNDSYNPSIYQDIQPDKTYKKTQLYTS